LKKFLRKVEEVSLACKTQDSPRNVKKMMMKKVVGVWQMSLKTTLKQRWKTRKSCNDCTSNKPVCDEHSQTISRYVNYYNL